MGIPNTLIKNAPTIGTTKNAFVDGPKRCTAADILANAFGVAPSPCPANPATITAAS